MTKEALWSLVEDGESRSILMDWHRTRVNFNTYKRWVDLWRED
ncbi:ThaI family type II restriction endonuclease [Candidatus Hakubella thermalkaliphila]